MGKVEDSVRKKMRRTRINSAVIGALAISGGLAIAVLAPNVLGALGKTGLLPQRRQAVKKSLTKLIEHGYVVLEHGHAQLTSKGEAYAALIGEGKLVPKKSRRWDGKWRVLIFDIPERRRGTR
ncbi:MAG: hypothetical protein Q8P58_02785, partial [Candidatus Adlerbacteria bacterium]|nr:hypothetical protein [Candidatus Adlerbacteria bacterium]